MKMLNKKNETQQTLFDEINAFNSSIEQQNYKVEQMKEKLEAANFNIRGITETVENESTANEELRLRFEEDQKVHEERYSILETTVGRMEERINELKKELEDLSKEIRSPTPVPLNIPPAPTLTLRPSRKGRKRRLTVTSDNELEPSNEPQSSNNADEREPSSKRRRLESRNSPKPKQSRRKHKRTSRRKKRQRDSVFGDQFSFYFLNLSIVENDDEIPQPKIRRVEESEALGTEMPALEPDGEIFHPNDMKIQAERDGYAQYVPDTTIDIDQVATRDINDFIVVDKFTFVHDHPSEIQSQCNPFQKRLRLCLLVFFSSHDLCFMYSVGVRPKTTTILNYSRWCAR